MRDIIAVILNEWTKLLRRRRFLVTAGLSVLVVALFSVVTYHDHQNQLRYNSGAQLQAEAVSLQNQIKQVKGDNSVSNKPQVLASMQQQLDSIETELALQNAGSNWRPYVQTAVSRLRQEIAQLSSQNQPAVNAGQLNADQEQLRKLQYSLSQNVKPLPAGHQTAYQATSNFLDVASRIFLPLLMIVLVADMVSGEATDGTIKLLLIRPVSRFKILLGKWLVSLFAGVLWTLAVCTALLLSGFAILGTAGGDQPVTVGTRYTFAQLPMNGNGPAPLVAIAHFDHASTLPYWQFYLSALLLTAFAMAVTATVAFLCSTLFKSTMASTAVAMGSVVLGFIVVNMAQHESWIRWLFPTHLDLLTNWVGDLSMRTQQSMTLASGLLVLAVWAVVSLAVSLFQFTRRDVLNA